MKNMMLTFVLLSVFSFGMLPADSRMIPPRFNPREPIELTMAEDSVDDKYDRCEIPMEERVDKEYIKVEIGINRLTSFGEVWQQQTNNCTKKGIKLAEELGNKELMSDHIRAICAYTKGGPVNLHKMFNKAVRYGRKPYIGVSKPFEFHTLHFWLTEAIKILKKGDKNKSCYVTFRGTPAKYTNGVENQLMRFGQFASSSKNVDTANGFGKETCFKINTCYGADLGKYPVMGDKEQEVLIPPYELFKIVSIIGKEENKCDCNKCITVESAGVLSSLNCTDVKAP